MMTQSVMTQAANLIGNTVGSVTNKGKKAANDFSQLMDNNLKATNANTTKADVSSTKKLNVKADKKQDNVQSDKKTSNAKDDSVKTPAKTDSANTSDQKTDKTQSDNTKIDEKEDVKQNDQTPVDEQLVAQIQNMLQTVQQVIMNKLNLNTDEFNQLLKDQGINLTDLLQPEKLQQFILAGSGATDITSVLTDENLADTMQQLMQNVEQIKTDAKLGLTDDQMKALLDQYQKLSDTQQITASDFTVQQSVTQDDNNKLSQTTATSKATDEQKDNASTKTSTETGVQSEAIKPTAEKTSDSGAHLNSDKDKNKNLNFTDKFQNFVDNLVKVSQNSTTEFTGELNQVTNLREIANQIVERIKVSVTTDQTSMELQLNPESLGKVNLSVQSKEGVMTAHFVVQNEISKEAIESQIQTLRDTLNQQGIKVEAIEVTVSSNAFEQNNKQASDNQTESNEKNTGKRISLDDAIKMTDVTEDDNNQEDISGVRGTMVDYTA